MRETKRATPNVYAPPAAATPSSAARPFDRLTTLAIVCMGGLTFDGVVRRTFNWMGTEAAIRQGIFAELVDVTVKPLALASFVLFAIWIYRAVKNLKGLGVPIKESPLGAVFWMFVPCFNFVVAGIVLTRIASASRPDKRAPLSVIVWWASFVVSLGAGFARGRLRNAGHAASSSETLEGLISLGLIVAFVALSMTMTSVARGQRELVATSRA